MTERVLVVGAVIIRDGPSEREVLAARRTSGPPELRGLWEFPGGKVEEGESPEWALQREVQEELGFQVDLTGEIAHADGFWPISDRHHMRLLTGTIGSGEPTPGDSHDEITWVTAGELDSLVWLPSDTAALDAVAQLLLR